jgi:hypothetical protein
MYRPSRIANEANIQDTHPKNWFSEIPFAAIPYLQKYMTNSRTKIRVIDIDTAIEQFFQDPNLSTYFANIPDYSAQQIGKISINVTDKDWQDLYLKDVKICHILGKEKPRIFYNNGKYGCDFYDDSVKTAFYANEMFSANYSHVVKNQIFEPFYWTADLPEIVIKQCQMVKESAQENIESFQRFFPNETYQYLNNNGFKYKGELSTSQLQLKRSNPDINNSIWLDQNGNYMLPFFKNNPKSMNDIITSEKNQHPYEYMAYYIEEE